MADTLTVDVISDVMCPWCYVGKRRLAGALALVPEVTAKVTWKPFRLDPTIPPEGISRDAYLDKKFGPDRAAGMYAELTTVGESEGIPFRFDLITRSPNTVDAHRLIRWAQAEGLGDECVERLFSAYFSEGRDVGETDVLAGIADDIGMSDTAARLLSDEDRDTTVAEIENAYRIGVRGVPAFIFAGKVVAMGAYPPETLVQAIEQALTEADRPPDGAAA